MLEWVCDLHAVPVDVGGRAARRDGEALRVAHEDRARDPPMARLTSATPGV